MELKLVNSKKKVSVEDKIFTVEFNESLVHQVVTAYLSGARAGTHAQKTRAEVSGGGIKPWRQKGTGRARAGTIRSPIWRKGGKTFAAKTQSYAQKVNKKMYRGAIRAIFSELIRQERLNVVDAIKADTHKTKDFLSQMAEWKLGNKILIITENVEKNIYLASRNVPNIEVRDVATAVSDPAALVGAEQVLITTDAMKKLEEVLV